MPIRYDDSEGTAQITMRRRMHKTHLRVSDDPRGAVKAVNKARLKVTPVRLREVADLVRTCEGKPVDAVSDALGVAHRAAQLWIKRARDNVDPETGQPYLEAR
jgi:hypothetical protein